MRLGELLSSERANKNGSGYGGLAYYMITYYMRVVIRRCMPDIETKKACYLA